MSNQRFIYKNIDHQGFKTLNIISATDKLNRWMYQSIKPYLKGEILEIGSGIGNITQYVLDDKFNITASDLRDNYCSILNKRFDKNIYLREVRIIDIVHSNFDIEYHDMFEKFDCIFTLNAVEHIENDKLALQNCRKLLRKNGVFIILVPAFQVLYNTFDEELHHFRRYTKSGLEKLLKNADYKILKTQYFNFIGIFGWWFSGYVIKNKILPENQLLLFNKLVPVFKIIDKLVLKKIGLSVISVSEKK